MITLKISAKLLTLLQRRARCTDMQEKVFSPARFT
jgi:hypothetical protein